MRLWIYGFMSRPSVGSRRTRSRTDVDNPKAATGTIRHLSLCAGYGGIDIGLRRVLPGLRTVCYSEIEIFAINNLVEKMQQCPDLLHPAPIWTNLKTLPLRELGEILGSNSLISGGFPCQPFSCAGARLGDEDPRHLFPYIKNAIRVIQPRIVFLENVQGIVSAKLRGNHWGDPEGTPVLLHVLRELERVGYRATAGIFSAEVDAGLPHQRKRVFILGERLAYPGSTRSTIRVPGQEQGEEGQPEEFNHNSCGPAPARPGQPQHWWEPPRVITGAELDNPGSNVPPKIPGNDGEVLKVSPEQGEEQCAPISGGAGTEGAELGNTQHRGQHQRKSRIRQPEEGKGCKHGEVTNRPNQRETQPQVGGTPPGPATGVVPTHLQQTYQSLGVSTMNRASELMLLGNGVVPEVAARAFEILSKELE
jgi:DNA (cytosine-5)-methyltransferase 1